MSHRLQRQLSFAALILAALSALFWAYRHWKENRFDEAIAAAARRYQLDPALVKAVIWRESGFNPNVVGRAGELGLMQVRDAAAYEWAAAERITAFEHENCLNPVTNIFAGAWYLRNALRRYHAADNPASFALADYNAGRGNVLKWQTGAAATNGAAFLARIQFPSTRAYVLSILKRAQHYRERGDFKS